MSPSSSGCSARCRTLALREREHVGRLVLAAVLAVEHADLVVGREPQPDLEVLVTVAARGGLDHTRELPLERCCVATGTATPSSTTRSSGMATRFGRT